MKAIFYTLMALLLSVSAIAQTKMKQDADAIKQMCGCYEVTFNFAETFNYSEDSLYRPSEIKVDKGLEWAQLVVDEKDKISIQHLLQVGNPTEPYIVKHWRQDWLFENTDLYIYNGDNNWTYESLDKSDVKGQWTQKVYQVDDSPRYEGSASWVHVDGRSYWESTTPAPLPRREMTKRNDYNITMRGNRHEITSDGWIHDQDNDKVLRESGNADIVIAKEKGYNEYIKVDDSRCKGASDWWVAHQDKWAVVRKKWAEVFARHKDLSLAPKVDNKALYKHLFDEELQESPIIGSVIESFIQK